MARVGEEFPLPILRRAAWYSVRNSWKVRGPTPPPHESDQRDDRGGKAADHRLGEGDGIDHKLKTTEVSEGIRVGRIDELSEDVATCHRMSGWIGLQGLRREVRVGPEIDYNSPTGGSNYTSDYLPSSSFVTVMAVPEPGTIALMLAGLAATLGAARIRN
jgi:hypothetical protein